MRRRGLVVLCTVLVAMTVGGCDVVTVLKEPNIPVKVEEDKEPEKGVETDIERPIEVVGATIGIGWSSDYDYNKAIRIESSKEWDKFISVYGIEASSIAGYKAKYSDKFFEKRIVYVYILEQGSSTTKISVAGARVKGSEMTLEVEARSPMIGTNDMVSRIVVFGVGRDDTRGVTDVVLEYNSILEE